jgi:hypothetical protein
MDGAGDDSTIVTADKRDPPALGALPPTLRSVPLLRKRSLLPQHQKAELSPSRDAPAANGVEMRKIHSALTGSNCVSGMLEERQGATDFDARSTGKRGGSPGRRAVEVAN